MSKRGDNKPKMDNVEEVDTDQPCSSSSLDKPVKSKEERRAELDTLYWEYFDDFGEKFVPKERERRNCYTTFYPLKDGRDNKQKKITELRPVDKACVGCGCRDKKMQFHDDKICHPCNRNVTTAECPCKGVPQLLNECVPIWSEKFQMQSDCQRCKKVALGKLNKSTNEKPPECTLEGGYARFQDLTTINIPCLFPEDAEMGALIVRAMKFTETKKRVLANALVKFRLDDPLIIALNGLQQVLRVELKQIKVDRTLEEGFRLVKIEDKQPLEFGLSANNKWTSIPAREINMYNLADILSNVKLNSHEGQGIQTEMLIPQMKLRPGLEYASLTCLESHLKNRGAQLIWTETDKKGTPLLYVQPDAKEGKKVIKKNRKGLIYLYGIEADDYILVSVGSTTDDKPRRHQENQTTALVIYKQNKSALKEFSCVLCYVPVDDDDVLLMYESILQNAFLLAQLNGLSFKNFVPPFTGATNQFNQNKWKDLDVKNMPDKPIKLLNRYIITRHYTQLQFDKMVNFFIVLLKVEFGIEYDWNEDPLKFSPSK